MRCMLVFSALLPAAAHAAVLPQDELFEVRSLVLSSLSEGEAGAALSTARAFLENTQGHPQAAALVAGVLASEGRWEEADATMKMAVDRASEQDQRRLAYFQWALVHAGGSDGFDLDKRPADFFRVADAGIEALGGDAALVEALAHRATFFFAALHTNSEGTTVSRYATEIHDWLSELCREHPDIARVHYCLGSLVGTHFHDHPKAVEHLARAAELEPDGKRSKWIFNGWGEALMRSGDASAAENAFRLALTKKHAYGIDDGSIIESMALSQALQGEFEEAESTCQRSMRWAKEKYGEDFEFDAAVKLASILKHRRDGDTRRMREVINEYARFTGSPSPHETRRLKNQILAAFKSRTSALTYVLLAGCVVVLLAVAGCFLRRKRGSSGWPKDKTAAIVPPGPTD